MLTAIARKIPFVLALPALVACNGTVVFGGAGAGGEPAATGGDTTSGGPWMGSSTSGGWMTTSATASSGVGGPPAYECSGPNSGSSSTPCTIQDPGCNPGL